MRHKIIRYFGLIFAIGVTSLVVSRLRMTTTEIIPKSDFNQHGSDVLSNRLLAEINLRLQGIIQNFTNQPFPASIPNTNHEIKNENHNEDEFDFIKRYPEIHNCKNEYNKWRPELTAIENSSLLNYSVASPIELHNLRITRAVVVYFPIDGLANFQSELSGLYRSWINIQKYEPVKWRTDLIVFIENNQSFFNSSEFFLNQLNCKFENVRRSSEEKPMCTLINYQALEKRTLTAKGGHLDNMSPENLYSYLLKEVDIFKSDPDQLYVFLKAIQRELSRYRYLNSILMAFEGYEYFKQAGYDFLIRSDMDVFLAPFFSVWVPYHCNDFNVGRGAFSTDFNEKRLSRAAHRLKFKYAFKRNLGSTWYSTPEQFRLVSYLTLFGMMYVANEEFSQTEREGKLGVAGWPYWHYGVLLLYGQSVALNHLIATNQMNVVRQVELLDYPSGNSHPASRVLHIHVFHGDDMFSKFAFKSGRYDNMTAVESDEIKYYALWMALEGKRISSHNLFSMLEATTVNKT